MQVQIVEYVGVSVQKLFFFVQNNHFLVYKALPLRTYGFFKKNLRQTVACLSYIFRIACSAFCSARTLSLLLGDYLLKSLNNLHNVFPSFCFNIRMEESTNTILQFFSFFSNVSILFKFRDNPQLMQTR
jgi:hypothetical protein